MFTHTHTHTHIYIYICIVCVCACLFACAGLARNRQAVTEFFLRQFSTVGCPRSQGYASLFRLFTTEYSNNPFALFCVCFGQSHSRLHKRAEVCVGSAPGLSSYSACSRYLPYGRNFDRTFHRF